MLKLWPPTVPIDGHGESLQNAGTPGDLVESACLARQAIHLEPQPGGWKITIDSTIETGKVVLFIPENRDEPARIVSDTRKDSTSVGFDQLYSRGYYAEAAVVAERELLATRQSAKATGDVSNETTCPNATDEDCRTLVNVLRQVSMASHRNGDYERAESALNEAIASCETAPAEFAETLIRLIHDRANVWYLHRCTDEESTLNVRRELNRARDRSEQLLGHDHPETARVMTSQARLFISEFSYPEAEDLLTEALKIRTKVLGAEHLDVSESLLELARLNAYRENHDEANDGFRQALAIREARCGLCHPDVAEVLFHYTDFLIYNRVDGAKASSLLRRALAIWGDTIGLDHSIVVRESGFIRKVLGTEIEAELPH